MNEIELIRRNLELRPDDPQVYIDAVAIIYDCTQKPGESLEARCLNRVVRRRIQGAIRRSSDQYDALILNDTYYKSLLIDVPLDFDAYCQYVEKDRDVRKRFYLPRRKQLLPVVNALQRLLDDETDLLGISLPPGVGKTTLSIFLLTWVDWIAWQLPKICETYEDAAEKLKEVIEREWWNNAGT